MKKRVFAIRSEETKHLGVRQVWSLTQTFSNEAFSLKQSDMTTFLLGPWLCHLSSKKSLMGPRPAEVTVRKESEQSSPRWGGSLICYPGILIICFAKSKQNITAWMTRPGVCSKLQFEKGVHHTEDGQWSPVSKGVVNSFPSTDNSLSKCPEKKMIIFRSVIFSWLKRICNMLRHIDRIANLLFKKVCDVRYGAYMRFSKPT